MGRSIQDWRAALTQALEQEGLVGSKEQELFLAQCQWLELSAHDTFLEAGEISQRLGYLIDGALICSHMNANMDQEVEALFVSSDWVLDHRSFVKQEPSVNEIRTLEPTQIVWIGLQQLHELIAHSQQFLMLGKIFMNHHRPFPHFDKKMSPTEKYQGILEQRPKIISRFPLKAIASYLDMTPETLSRVRSKLAKRRIS